MERGSEDPFAALFTGSIKAKIAGSIKAIIDREHLPDIFHGLLGAGSSPRVWGTLQRTDDAAPYSRFIPTCVGNMHLELGNPVQNTVHPHVCGEHGFKLRIP